MLTIWSHYLDKATTESARAISKPATEFNLLPLSKTTEKFGIFGFLPHFTIGKTLESFSFSL